MNSNYTSPAIFILNIMALTICYKNINEELISNQQLDNLETF